MWRNTPSALGERQILPVQTNSTLVILGAGKGVNRTSRRQCCTASIKEWLMVNPRQFGGNTYKDQILERLGTRSKATSRCGGMPTDCRRISGSPVQQSAFLEPVQGVAGGGGLFEFEIARMVHHLLLKAANLARQGLVITQNLGRELLFLGAG